MQAVILAGGDKVDQFLTDHGVTNKALLPIAGQAMVSYIVRALRDTGKIDDMYMVGPKEGLEALNLAGVTVIQETGDMLGNIKAGLLRCEPDELVLVSTSDIPMVRAPMLAAVIEQASRGDFDLLYSICTREKTEARFPGVHRTYVKLREGTFTGGNVVLCRPRAVLPALDRASIFVENRKKPVKTARAIGFRYLIRLLLGRLTIAELESRISGMFHIKGKAWQCPYPEIGTDVDKQSDWELAERELGAK